MDEQGLPLASWETLPFVAVGLELSSLEHWALALVVLDVELSWDSPLVLHCGQEGCH